MEFRAEFLADKITAAEQAISARLSDPTPTNDEERLALEDSLKSLRVLGSEPTSSGKTRLT